MGSTFRVQVPVLPARLRPEHASEMTTQFLFGECLERLEEQGEWWLVQRKIECYPAWVRTSGLVAVSNLCEEGVFQQRLIQQFNGDLGLVWIPLGSKIQGAKQAVPELDEWANMWKGAPYLWGGKTMMGIDCSGLSQLFWESRGILLPRDASQQALVGLEVSWLFDSQPGDLVFFDGAEGKITHVGILLSPNKVLHAAGMVRMDLIDQQGIYIAEEGRYSHSLRLIRRPVAPAVQG